MNPLSELKPGDHISYDYIVGLNDICAGQGEVVEISEEAIRVRKKSGYFDTLHIRDIERNETRILGLKPKKEENMGKQREIPNYTELRKAFQESGYKIAPVQREFKTHWDTARRWLFNAGLIDETNKPTEKAKENEPKQMFSKEEGKPVETAIESKDNTCAICGDATKAHERFWCEGKVVCYECQAALGVKAQIDAEPPDASPHEFNAGEVSHAMPDTQTPVSGPASRVKGRELCVACGEIADFKVDGQWYCYKHEPAGSQYEPEDNDYQDETEQVITAAANRAFERKGFVLEVIANIIELAEVRQTPAELTVELIDAILVVA